MRYPYERRTAARRSISGASSGVSGRRKAFSQSPISARADFTGMGFVVMNIVFIRPKYLRLMRFASSTYPAKYASIICFSLSPQTCDATLTTPTPPTERMGRVSVSSPE